jgi:hypothetical protein
MNYNVERQLTVAIENQPGRLAAVAELLAERGININDLSIIDTIEQGVIRLVTSDAAQAKLLFVQQGLYCLEADVVCVDLPDTPGMLAALSRALGAAQVNIDYAYGSEGPGEQQMRLVLKVSNLERALEVLASLNPL